MQMWNSQKVRESFLSFFESKQHQIVASAPVVVKNDPTLMFVNAGMNQFKDVFLGNEIPKSKRVVNSQKCLRVSGKHNDLEEVGVDTYHHTLFEMLGNWSFGDYFKKEAIAWAWELLTEVYQLDKERLYVTYFQGDSADDLEEDVETKEIWKDYIAANRVIPASKKDNFWEMGDVGPCGPCTEIHIDLRSDFERNAVNAIELINKDHPQVIEIWNLVFIQFNRSQSGSLSSLPAKHVDTGMGLERLCMALQSKKSNYDTDIFQRIISKVETLSGLNYEASNSKKDIAFRVISDHLRAIAFTIADGQIPSNTGAGYVIRRILRRAVRYGYSFLNLKSPFLYSLLDELIAAFGDYFPELSAQKEFIQKVMLEEESAFLRTLEIGIQKIDKFILESTIKTVPGAFAFELYDTFGFPIDLTSLILSENGFEVDRLGFEKELEKQKNRSRAATTVKHGDWVVLNTNQEVQFLGFDQLDCKSKITKYRSVQAKGKEIYQIVLNQTPFYPEGGGQIGDSGYLMSANERIEVLNTIKENNLIIHEVNALPENPDLEFEAVVNKIKRQNTTIHHTATHLLHYSLRKVLGTHVVQKGSLVNDNSLRFDFSHFGKMEKAEIEAVELEVNQMVRKAISLKEFRSISMQEAENMNAMMLFGEKYGERVRVIKFDDSVELCGGCHVSNTANVGFFKILTEASVASGVRRIEAIAGDFAIAFVQDNLAKLDAITEKLKSKDDVLAALQQLQERLKALEKQNQALLDKEVEQMKANIKNDFELINGANVLVKHININAKSIKDLVFSLKSNERAIVVIGSEDNGKANLQIGISDDFTDKFKANELIKMGSSMINGGGGGQAAYASAGGSNPSGISEALKAIKLYLTKA